MIKIRNMKNNDIKLVKDIEATVYKYNSPDINFEKELNNQFANYIVAEQDEQKNKSLIIGFAGIWIFKDEIHIAQIAIHSDWQRTGIGCQLLNKIYEITRSTDNKKILLEVHENNQAAIEFYLKNKFIITGKKQKYYQNITGNNDAVKMEKLLLCT
jgi:[ribosomal protein S18]-alanine N-acetyltransferase|tara:strand:- start:1814 stop:2281 length:468 start_codon:yes stop_codon:yes gene_type:complete